MLLEKGNKVEDIWDKYSRTQTTKTKINKQDYVKPIEKILVDHTSEKRLKFKTYKKHKKLKRKKDYHLFNEQKRTNQIFQNKTHK